MGSWFSTPVQTFAVKNTSQYHVLVFLSSGSGPVAQCPPYSSTQAYHAFLPPGASLRAFVINGTLLVPLSETWDEPSIVRAGQMIVTAATVSDHVAAAVAKEIAGGKILKFFLSRARRNIHRRHVAAGAIVQFLLNGARRNLRHRHATVTALQAVIRGGRVRTAKRRCVICMEDRPALATASLSACTESHAFCCGCYSRYVRTAVEDGKLHIECAGEGCRVQFRGSGADVLALTGRKTLAKFKTLGTAARGSYLQKLNDGEAGDEGFREFARQHTRACPSCSVVIFRHAGCDHMSCRCGRRFNWGSGPRVAEHAAPKLGGAIGAASEPLKGILAIDDADSFPSLPPPGRPRLLHWARSIVQRTTTRSDERRGVAVSVVTRSVLCE